VSHRLYSALDAHDKCSAQRWRDLAQREIEEVLEQGRHPVVVGGTGLYLKALMEGLSEMPDVSAEIRAQTMALQQQLGNPGFHAALAERDPVMGAKLNPNDTQRLIRAYEVFEATGESLATWQSTPLQGPPAHWRFNVIITTPDRAVLHDRCDRRFDLMIECGALDEVRSCIDLPDEAPVTHALGFRPLRDYLKGLMSREGATIRAKAETRQYAKRQDTWFRHQIKPNSAIDEIRRVS
jgi:tRNA dimethylallyltransferase